ncbi:hypothetical protein CCHR01_17744 [Colletotrichum chrysophilum]|uniref:Uncharacterized protein n=1 Tax=Colletotrichum chrysophilum TaxID=1836956 RepID=A0AAD9A1Z7_9PEZI|nr:hypothetical protein CCHR01_17744 [Colletotrichum chrysophilum]
MAQAWATASNVQLTADILKRLRDRVLPANIINWMFMLASWTLPFWAVPLTSEL